MATYVCKTPHPLGSLAFHLGLQQALRKLQHDDDCPTEIQFEFQRCGTGSGVGSAAKRIAEYTRKEKSFQWMDV